MRTDAEEMGTSTSARTPDAHRYLADLDGLRALAVVPVVLYHAGAHWMPGGFVGVDVFFVLSGFFITRQLRDDLTSREFSLWQFYERRARRILPALFVVLALTMAASTLILAPSDLSSFCESLLATLGFVSNFHFWLDSSYFAQAADLKPLLHTWSLAVEEQFYIFFPIALWVLWRFGRRLVIPISGLAALVSLGLCVWGAYNVPSASFYLLPTRAWELLAGALIALAPAPRWAALWRHVASCTGLALIIASLFLIRESILFPGWAAVFPVSGSSLLILASRAGGGLGNAALSGKPVVFIGQISYSLYLWHWPPLALAQYALFRPPNALEACILVAISVVAAVLSWRFVESPFRGKASRIRAQALAAICTAGALGLGTAAGAILWARGLPDRFSTEARAFLEDKPFAIPATCFGLPPETIREGNACTIGGPNVPPTLAIWGDSHAGRSAETFDALGKAGNFSLRYYSKGSCPPLQGAVWADDLLGCGAFNAATTADLAAIRPTAVVVSAMWAAYAEGTVLSDANNLNFLHDTETRVRSRQENSRVFARSLRRTVQHLRGIGAQVVLIGPYPELLGSAPTQLALAVQHGRPPPRGLSIASFVERQRHVLPILQELDAIEGVTVIYPHNALCDNEYCYIELNGQRLYFDDNHIDVAANKILEPMFSAVLRDLGVAGAAMP